MARKLAEPPSSVTGVLGAWLRELHRVVEATPNVSIVSLSALSTPNSYVTGFVGDLCVNASDSASTVSRLWVLGTSGSARTDQGWALVRMLAV